MKKADRGQKRKKLDRDEVDAESDDVDAGDGIVDVRLSLAINWSSPRPSAPPPPPSRPPRQTPSCTPDLPLVIAPPPNPICGSRPAAVAAAPARAWRNPTQGPKDRSKGDVVPPAFPWCTDRRATVHPLAYLLSQGITEVHGEAQCSQCQARREIRYDLAAKFDEVAAFIRENKHLMHDRAPKRWTDPAFPACEACRKQNCVQPVVADKKRQINCLFMLLGQTLGCCSLKQLKYFCKHGNHHRTGAKNRLLYLTYLGLCKQLDPTQPLFNLN